MRKERQEAVEAKEQTKVDKEAAAKKEIEDVAEGKGRYRAGCSR
jgi:hypothetical protein